MNVFDIILKLKGLDINKAQRWICNHKNDSLLLRDQMVKYHLKNNPLYKSLLRDANISKFEDLPIIKKKDFQHPLKDIISDEYNLKDLYISNTSGSSGHPFFFAKNKEAHAITHAIIRNLYSQHGINIHMKQARFYGIPAGGLGYYKEKIKDIIANRVRFPIFDLSDQNLERYLKKFQNIKFGYIYGYTSAIVLFSKFLIRRGMVLKNVCPTLKLCIVTSEVCTVEDKDIISSALGVRVINEYGCSEAGLIAFENPEGLWKIVEGENYFEVVDNNGNPVPYGTEGRILITSLTNKAIPIVRYEVGDIGIIEKTNDGLVLKSLCGRVSDVIKLPSGRIAGGLTFYYVSKSIMEGSNFVKEFIVRQTKIDTFVFDIVSDRDLDKKDISVLQSKLDEYLEPGLKLVINKVPKIDRPKSGKIKHFYSEI